MLDIHDYPKRLKRELKKLATCEISEQNKELIRLYVQDKMLVGVSVPRQVKYIEVLRNSAKKICKDYDACEIMDIKKWAMGLQNKYTVHTRMTHQSIMKTFFKWMKKTEDGYPPEVRWLRTSVKRNEKKQLSEKELITAEEVLGAIDTCQNLRDKALLAILAESGARVGEIGNLQMKNLHIDERGAVLTVKGKTGSRRVRIISSTRYLVVWINMHPLREDPEAPLWTTTIRPYRQICYATIARIVKNAFKEAGVKKRVYPHLFRHSRASVLASHLTEFQMNQYFGWIQGSDMPSTYVHMTGRDLDEALLRLNGYEVKSEAKKDGLRARVCPRCEVPNTPDSIYCCKCAETLDPKVVIQQERERLENKKKEMDKEALMKKLLEDDDMREMVLKKVMELDLGAHLKV